MMETAVDTYYLGMDAGNHTEEHMDASDYGHLLDLTDADDSSSLSDEEYSSDDEDSEFTDSSETAPIIDVEGMRYVSDDSVGTYGLTPALGQKIDNGPSYTTPVKSAQVHGPIHHYGNSNGYVMGYPLYKDKDSPSAGQPEIATAYMGNGTGASDLPPLKRKLTRSSLKQLGTAEHRQNARALPPIAQRENRRLVPERRPTAPTMRNGPRQASSDEDVPALERKDSTGSIQSTRSTRSTLSVSVAHNTLKKSNIVPYSGGTGLKDPLGVNRTGKDRPELGLTKKGAKGTNSIRSRNLEKLRRSMSGRSLGSLFGGRGLGSDDDSDEDDDDEDGPTVKDNREWYRGVPRGLHMPYGREGYEETRGEREKRIERQWREKQRELKEKKKAEKRGKR